MFSTRVPDDRRPNDLAVALARARARGPLLDLTVSNPTRVGIQYPPDLLAALAAPAALTYQPAPLGMRDAREAVAATFARRGLRMDPDRIVLTASTSEGYSLLFKLLCEPGRSNVLTPVPSYPLFDHLTRLDGVDQRRYALEYHGTWSVDVECMDAAWTGDTRAVLAVSPNNPTGSMLTGAELAGLVDRCAAREAALIIDEVFVDYPLSVNGLVPAAVRDCLMFRLGGLSKSAGLPQVKLGWIVVDGPDALVRSALDRLELICDTYLSVSTPVQHAAPELIAAGAQVRGRILDRIRANDRALRQLSASYPSIEALPCEAGWSAVLRVPSTRSEEDLAIALLESSGVVVHPGFFFDFAHEAFLVVSLLPQPEVFTDGIRRVMETAHA